MSEVRSPEENDDFEIEFEPYHFHASKDIKEDYDLLFEQSQKRHKYWLSDYALRRVRMNQNYILLIVGGVGTGKSYTAMSLAEDIDPYFSVDRVIFHPRDFIELLDRGLPKGSVIMWEEVGVSLSSRDWYKEQNKIVSSLFETFRRHNLILIMTVPFVKFIDSRIRSMIHGFAEMIDPTFTGGQFGWLKYYHVIVEQRTGKIKHRYPRIRDDEGKIQIIQGVNSESGNMHFNLPSKELIPLYEKKKLEFVKWQQETGLKHFELDDSKESKFIEIEDFIRIFTSNPRKYHLIVQDESDKMTLTNLIENNWVLLKLDYPDKIMRKKDMVSALRFVLHSYDFPFKKTGTKIQDNEIDTIIRLLDIVGGNRNQVAKMLNTTLPTLTRKINQWKADGTWDEKIKEIKGVTDDDEYHNYEDSEEG